MSEYKDHFITICQCGRVLSQCRCPSKDKRVINVKSCEQCQGKDLGAERGAK